MNVANEKIMPDSELEARYERYKGVIKNFTLMSDIFITRDDVLGYGLPIYHIDKQIKEVDESFQDEAHIIYVNSRKQEDTELGKLMHDLHCKDADEMHSPVLAKRVHELKDTQ